MDNNLTKRNQSIYKSYKVYNFWKSPYGTLILHLTDEVLGGWLNMIQSSVALFLFYISLKPGLKPLTYFIANYVLNLYTNYCQKTSSSME